MSKALESSFSQVEAITSVQRRRRSSAAETWSETDIAKFREHWPVGSAQRIAFEILLYTGLRRSDAVWLGPQHLKDDHIAITARKTGAQLHIPMHGEFRAVLDTVPHKHLVFIATVHGARDPSSPSPIG